MFWCSCDANRSVRYFSRSVFFLVGFHNLSAAPIGIWDVNILFVPADRRAMCIWDEVGLRVYMYNGKKYCSEMFIARVAGEVSYTIDRSGVICGL